MHFSKLQTETQKRLLPFYLLVSVILLSSLNFFFFWDKDILNSRQAFYYLEHGFSFLAPPGMDSGHPPIMGWLLAGSWKIFGTNLAISHLVMFPFAIGMVWQLYRFTSFFLPAKSRYLVLLLTILDTSLLSQLVILTGELILVFLFFLAVNSVLNKKYLLLAIATIFLGLSSSRGTMSCVIVVLFHLVTIYREKQLSGLFKDFFKLALIYLPAVLITGGYLLFHYKATGWIGYDPDGEHWVQLFQRTDLSGAIRNSFILGWRLIDFGRLFLWLIGGYFLILFLRKKMRMDSKIITLLWLAFISLLIYSPSWIMYTGLLSHRYIIPIYIIISVLIGYILFEKFDFLRLKKYLFGILLIGLLSGNFWVYPDSIAKGWDATLAHIPYYKLRRDMIKYLETEKIPISKVGTEVPNNAPIKFVDLKNDSRIFPYKNMETQEYILYSNIYNMFTNEELRELKEDWLLIKEYKLLQVRVSLYHKPEN